MEPDTSPPLSLNTRQSLGAPSANNPSLLAEPSLLQHTLLAPPHTSPVEPRLARALRSLPHQQTSNSYPEVTDLKFASYRHIPQHKSSPQVQLC